MKHWLYTYIQSGLYNIYKFTRGNNNIKLVPQVVSSDSSPDTRDTWDSATAAVLLLTAVDSAGGNTVCCLYQFSWI